MRRTKEQPEAEPLLAPGAGGAVEFTRGKYRGKPLASVSASYLDFVMGHARVSQEDGRLLVAEWGTRRFGRAMTWEEVMGRINSDLKELLAESRGDA